MIYDLLGFAFVLILLGLMPVKDLGALPVMLSDPQGIFTSWGDEGWIEPKDGAEGGRHHKTRMKVSLLSQTPLTHWKTAVRMTHRLMTMMRTVPVEMTP